MGDFVTAERRRVIERKEAFDNKRGVIRPKDARWENPLGVLEREFENALERLEKEEKERLRNVLKVMKENRPMEVSRESPLGFIEALAVGLLRAPKVMVAVFERIMELLQSEKLGMPPQKDQDESKKTNIDKDI